MAREEKAKPKSRARQKSAPDRPRQRPDDLAAAEPARRAEASVWHERAAFQVAYDYAARPSDDVTWQTRAYHEESGDRAVWPGIAGGPLVEWMRDKAELPVEEPPAPSPAAEPPVETLAGLPALPLAEESPAGGPGEERLAEPLSDLRCEIGDLQLTEAPAEQEVGGQTSVRRMRAQIDFQISGTATYIATAHQSSYAIQILSYDLATGRSALLAADRQQLQPELLAYSAAVEFELPEIGRYQLLGTVLFPADNAAEVALGPVLAVVP